MQFSRIEKTFQKRLDSLGGAWYNKGVARQESDADRTRQGQHGQKQPIATGMRFTRIKSKNPIPTAKAERKTEEKKKMRYRVTFKEYDTGDTRSITTTAEGILPAVENAKREAMEKWGMLIAFNYEIVKVERLSK